MHDSASSTEMYGRTDQTSKTPVAPPSPPLPIRHRSGQDGQERKSKSRFGAEVVAEENESRILTLDLCGNYAGLDACLRELPNSYQSKSGRLKGHFYYLTFRDGRQNIAKLAQYLYWRTMAFCLTRARRAELRQKFEETRDDRYVHEATDEARDLFVRARNSRDSTGEPGELLLFVLLEYFFKAPQVACKMSLKTAHNVPVFGADAVHMSYDSSKGLMLVYWGESKLREQLSSALDSTCSSVKDFISPRDHTKPQERDIKILQLHANIPDEATRRAYLKFFDPYEAADNQRRDIHACLAVVERSLFMGLDELPSDEVETEFCRRFQSMARDAAQMFEQKIAEAKLDREHFRLLLVPLEDLQELRLEFFRHLRIDIQEKDTIA